MELYRMKQGAAVSAQIVYLEEAKYAYSLTEDNYKKMPENSAGYYEYKKNVLIPDIMQNPTYMVSDMIQKVTEIYDSTISCKDIFIMPNDEKYLNKGVQMFHIPDLPRVDCTTGSNTTEWWSAGCDTEFHKSTKQRHISGRSHGRKYCYCIASVYGKCAKKRTFGRGVSESRMRGGKLEWVRRHFRQDCVRLSANMGL